VSSTAAPSQHLAVDPVRDLVTRKKEVPVRSLSWAGQVCASWAGPISVPASRPTTS
jgi:hypothetical protein